MMRILKKLIGWCCFVSLLAALVFAGYGAYMRIAPYFRGAVIKDVYWYMDYVSLIDELESGKPTKSDAALIREFALHPPLHVNTRSGWHALRQIYDPLSEYYPSSPVAAVALLDTDMRVLASYPGDFGARLPRSNVASHEETTIDLGRQGSGAKMSHIQVPDGDTVEATAGGLPCRRNQRQYEDIYFYFKLDDKFAYKGNHPDLDITVQYYDTKYSRLTLQYDSINGEYKEGQSVALGNSNTWKTKTYHVTDGYFGNRQNNGADFRIALTPGTRSYIKAVHVRDLGVWRKGLSALGGRYSWSSFPKAYALLNRRGESIGTLAVMWRSMPTEFAQIPPYARIDDIRLTPYIVLSSRNLMGLGGLALLVFCLLLPFWTAMDAAWRGTRPFAWGMLILLTNVIGLLAYVIARPAAPRKCANCGENVVSKFVRCPVCGVSVLFRCPVCRRKIKPGWQYCPVCKATPGAGGGVGQTRWDQVGEAPVAAYSSASVVGKPAKLLIRAADQDTGRAISGAALRVQGPSAFDGLTNAAGVFEARSPQDGFYVIEAAKEGYNAGRSEVEIGETSEEDLTLRLDPLPGRISGRALERDTLRALVGARVYVDSSRLDCSSESDATGGFVLSPAPPGPYTVCAEAEGFAGQTKLVEVLPGRQTQVDFVLEQTPEPVEEPAAAEGGQS
jgi:hypothetical protein